MGSQRGTERLNASLSQIKKKLKNFKLPGYDMTIEEMLTYADEKMSPIVEMLVEAPNSTQHFIGTKECDDIEETSYIIADIACMLETIGLQTSIKSIHLHMDKYRESANVKGDIYVDTILLLEILEIYNILESIRYDINAFYRSIGIHSFVQTEADTISLTSNDDSSTNPNKIVFKLKKSPAAAISSMALFNKEYLVMSSTSEIGPRLSGRESSVRRSKSADSVEEIRQVTDVYGARKVLVKCIYDLQEVSDYLGIPRKDVSTICSIVEVDGGPSQPRGSTVSDISAKSPRKSNVSDKSVKSVTKSTSEQPQDVQGVSSENKCCCPECFAHTEGSEANLRECEDDQVIICIKGCNEDEGDVQIVIRQCPDCKKAEDRSADKPLSQPEPRKDSKPPSPISPVPRESKPIIPSKRVSSVDFPIGRRSFTETPMKEIESITLHNKDSQGSLICSDEEDEQQKPIRKSTLVNSDSLQHRVSCSRIKLFETTNLCLQTDTGKELVISLTVTPKDLAGMPKKLSITDIFSENDVEDSRSRHSSTASRSSKLSNRSPRRSERKSSTGSSGRARESFFVADRYIPLGRTKVCSSLDFDVTTEESKIRHKGIQNKNNKIVVQLQKFGADNLLRACRPAKCCRKAILNEKMKKCLPYAASLRSLPLDDADMDVINQSLQMSLQKVKNSTNINKDFYSNQVNYFMNPAPIRTVMYFFLEEDLSKHQAIFVRQKLSYYINLVKDIQHDFTFPSPYAILYFGVDSSKLDKNLNNRSVKNGENLSDVDVKIAEVISNPLLKWMKRNYNKYDERPAVSSYNTNNNNNNNHRDFVVETMRNSVIKTNNNNFLSEPLKQCLERRDANNKAFTSKIPVYLGHKPLKSDIVHQDAVETTEMELYQVSLTSLAHKREKIITTEDLLRYPNKSTSRDNNKMKISNNVTSKSKSKTSSKYSVTTSQRRTKRKKKEFFVSRSKSEISMNAALKHNNLPKIKKYLTSSPLKAALTTDEKASAQTSSEKTSQTTSQASNTVNDQDPSKVILQYFCKMLYEMIMKQEVAGNTHQRHHQTSVCVGTENCNIQELYRNKPKLRNVSEISYHTLKAKHSQYCMLQATKANNDPNRICMFHNLALQTSKMFIADNKKCQTSNSLLAYFFNSTNSHHHHNHFKKKRIFKKTYNREDINVNGSCNEIENFIVTLKSDQSFGSNFSEGDYFMSSNSCSSRQLGDSDQEDSLSQSLMKLKETLEKYENVKSKIAARKPYESHIDPIEYFVYQVCACNNNNKFSKKPSVMQKILSKTKGLFSAVEKDMCKKYRNQREFFSMSPVDREELCHKCGCYISKCEEATPSNKQQQPPATSPLLCKCPPDNKGNNKRPKHSKPKPTTCMDNISKLASASTSSLKCIKGRIKKSMSDVMGSKKGPCACGKITSQKKTPAAMCVPQNTSVVTCEKKSTSTGTTKESFTQKCECGKCKNFSDDGTCCCSHCLGCLDKSFEAKPDSNSVGIETTVVETETDDGQKRRSTIQEKSDNNQNKAESGSKTTTVSSPPKLETRRSTIQEKSDKQNKVDSGSKTTVSSPPKLESRRSTIQEKSDDQSKVVSGSKTTTVSSPPKPESRRSTIQEKSDKQNKVDSGSKTTTVSSPPKQESSLQNVVVNPDNNNDLEPTDIETIDTNNEPDKDKDNKNNDSTAFFFVAPPPQFLQQFRKGTMGSANPFEQYMLNFPAMNTMFHVENPESVLDDAV